ncbi:hypothetical protein [Streptomyces sp. NPDC088196]|uniref:hypothetical protein n=1 Tax=Streptomyces sp. NPDC088196 TaxID=3154868 RepID=UPI003450F3DB
MSWATIDAPSSQTFGHTRTALEPLTDTLPPDLQRRLTMAVTLVYGIEALIATRDACGLDPEEAQDVMRWAASALLEKAMHEAPGDARGTG